MLGEILAKYTRSHLTKKLFPETLRESRFVFSPILNHKYIEPSPKNCLFFCDYFLKLSMSVEAPSQSIITQYRKQLFEIYPYTTPTLEYRCIHDIVEAEKIWKHFNPAPENIYQDWEYIKIFHEAYQYTPHFYTAYKDGAPVACLPLEWIPERNRLEMFGNRSYIHYLFSQTGYEYCTHLLRQQVKLPFESESIFCDKTSYLPLLQEVDKTYILDIRTIQDGVDYVARRYLEKKRNKILKEMRNLSAFNITIEDGNEADLEWFFMTNQKIFGDESAYHDVRRQNNIKHLYHSQKIPTFIRTFRLDGVIVAVRFLIKDPYNSTLYAINGATEKSIANLGKFVILDYINLGLSLGCEYVDLSSTSFGYKENWTNLTQPVYNFKK